MLHPSAYRDLVRRALEEDVGSGDITTHALVGQRERAHGTLIAKAPCTVAGVDIAAETFAQLDPNVAQRIVVKDGGDCAAGGVIAEFVGTGRALLTGERTALNFLQRLSGIATLARHYVRAANGAIVILDTRKTTPTMRALEKYAVRVGGATNHRMGLDDGILIKDNHVRLAGGVGASIAKARASGAKPVIEAEVETLEQVDEALAAGADILLLDNMPIGQIREAVRRARGRAKTEISGGVTLERIPELASTGADFVSSGALTHSAPAIDISFEIEPA
jgi:nicotinate-nucleotide pyrophosphorylase (carboxylating)